MSRTRKRIILQVQCTACTNKEKNYITGAVFWMCRQERVWRAQCTACVIKEEYDEWSALHVQTRKSMTGAVHCMCQTKQGHQSKNQQRLRQEKSSSWRGNRRHISQDLENWLKILIFNQVTVQHCGDTTLLCVNICTTSWWSESRGFRHEQEAQKEEIISISKCYLTMWKCRNIN